MATKSKADLETENEALRAQLQAIEAGEGVVSPDPPRFNFHIQLEVKRNDGNFGNALISFGVAGVTPENKDAALADGDVFVREFIEAFSGKLEKTVAGGRFNDVEPKPWVPSPSADTQGTTSAPPVVSVQYTPPPPPPSAGQTAVVDDVVLDDEEGGDGEEYVVLNLPTTEAADEGALVL